VTLNRLLSGVGRTLITAGVLILLFVVYQLWGTGIRTAQAQDRLDDAFEERLAAAEAFFASSSTSTSTTATTTDPNSTTTTLRLPAVTAPAIPPELLPARGDDAGRIVIPRIGIDWTFVEGVGVRDLRQGPGHYPDSPFPGQAGNAAIAGHRTTYGAPFGDLDVLQPGDEIDITTLQGEFTYVVRETQIVAPSQVEVLDADHWDFDGDGVPEPNVLTLTACHPKFSARERIVVGAELVGQPAPPSPTTTTTTVPGSDPEPAEPEVRSLDADLSGDRASAWPAIWWAVACALVWIGAWLVGRRRRRLKWLAYGIGLVPFLGALFFFFEEFSRLLPANY
jgi:sortase A